MPELIYEGNLKSWSEKYFQKYLYFAQHSTKTKNVHCTGCCSGRL